jgi:hypothetical protein
LDEAFPFERSIDCDVGERHTRGLAGEDFWLIELEPIGGGIVHRCESSPRGREGCREPRTPLRTSAAG